MRKVNITFLFALGVWALSACGGGGSGGLVSSDTMPPTISCVAVEPPALIVPGSTVVRIEADVTDNDSGVDTVSVAVAYPDGSADTKTLTSESGSRYAVQFTATWTGSQPGKILFTVSARDKAGNAQTSSALERRAVAPPPGSPW